jgi:Interferon-induced transmembrane protein
MSYEPPPGQAWNQAEGQPPPGQYGAPGQYGDPGQYGVPPGQYGQAPGQYGAPGPYGVPGQPGFAQSPYGKPPATYKPWAITCIVCGVLFSIIIGMPCGLVALRYSRRVQPAWVAGDQQGASQASRRAMIWAIVSTLFDLLGFIVVISLFSHGSGSTS